MMKKHIVKLGFIALFFGLSCNLMAQEIKYGNILNEIHELQEKGEWKGAYIKAKNIYERIEHPGVLREKAISCMKMDENHDCHKQLLAWKMFSGEDGDGAGLVLFGEDIFLDGDYDSYKVAFGYSLVAQHLFNLFEVNTLGDENWHQRAKELSKKSFNEIKNDKRWDEEKFDKTINIYMIELAKRASKWYERKSFEVKIVGEDEVENTKE